MHTCLPMQVLNTILIIVAFNPDSEKCKEWSEKNSPKRTVVILVLLSSVAALTLKLSTVAICDNDKVSRSCRPTVAHTKLILSS